MLQTRSFYPLWMAPPLSHLGRESHSQSRLFSQSLFFPSMHRGPCRRLAQSHWRSLPIFLGWHPLPWLHLGWCLPQRHLGRFEWRMAVWKRQQRLSLSRLRHLSWLLLGEVRNQCRGKIWGFLRLLCAVERHGRLAFWRLDCAIIRYSTGWSYYLTHLVYRSRMGLPQRHQRWERDDGLSKQLVVVNYLTWPRKVPVIVAATESPHCLTASTAFADVQCSSMILNFGNFWCSIMRVGKNFSSALSTVTSDPGADGLSPWRFNKISCRSIS